MRNQQKPTDILINRSQLFPTGTDRPTTGRAYVAESTRLTWLPLPSSVLLRAPQCQCDGCSRVLLLFRHKSSQYFPFSGRNIHPALLLDGSQLAGQQGSNPFQRQQRWCTHDMMRKRLNFNHDNVSPIFYPSIQTSTSVQETVFALRPGRLQTPCGEGSWPEAKVSSVSLLFSSASLSLTLMHTWCVLCMMVNGTGVTGMGCGVGLWGRNPESLSQFRFITGNNHCRTEVLPCSDPFGKWKPFSSRCCCCCWLLGVHPPGSFPSVRGQIN